MSLVDPAVLRTHLSTSIRHAHPDAHALAARMVGLVGAPVRVGKRLGIRLGDLDVLVHLGMTGRWIRRDEAPRHGRIGLHLDDGDAWWFENSRRFGCLVPVEDLHGALTDGLGPDALEDPPDGPALRDLVGGGRGSVKARLMDQQRLAGIGNIQATEALWFARVHPATPVKDLDEASWGRLAEGLQWTLRRTLEDAGEEELVYLSSDPTGNPFQVYGRVGAPCLRCGAGIETVRLSGRTSPFCPSCQVDPERNT